MPSHQDDVPYGRQSRANKVGFDVLLPEDAPEDGAEGSRFHAQSHVISMVSGVLSNPSRFGLGGCGDAGAIDGAETSDDRAGFEGHPDDKMGERVWRKMQPRRATARSMF